VDILRHQGTGGHLGHLVAERRDAREVAIDEALEPFLRQAGDRAEMDRGAQKAYVGVPRRGSARPKRCRRSARTGSWLGRPRRGPRTRSPPPREAPRRLHGDRPPSLEACRRWSDLPKSKRPETRSPRQWYPPAPPRLRVRQLMNQRPARPLMSWGFAPGVEAHAESNTARAIARVFTFPRARSLASRSR
jgi:hypothetical protein